MAERPIGPLFVRDHIASNMQALLVKGGVVPMHDHPFPHVGVVWAGGAHVTVEDPDGKTAFDGEAWAPAYINVPAGHKHTLRSLADGTIVHCLFPHRDPSTLEIVYDYNGWILAYGGISRS